MVSEEILTDIQLYQYMELFSIYTLLGWVCSVMYAALAGKKRKEYRVCKGPFCPSYGIGALGILLVAGKFSISPLTGAITGLVVGTLVELLTVAAVNGISRSDRIAYKWYHSLVWAVMGVIVTCHLNRLLLTAMFYAYSWINLVFLLIFWMVFLDMYIESIWILRKGKDTENKLTSNE